MSTRLLIDTDPQFPLDRGGQFGGHLLDESRNPMTFVRGQSNLIDIGIFHAGLWVAVPVWTNAWIQFKAMPSTGIPLATDTQLEKAGVATSSSTLDAWQAGTDLHGQIDLTSAKIASVSLGTVWMVVSLTDGAGNKQATVAAGRVTIEPA